MLQPIRSQLVLGHPPPAMPKYGAIGLSYGRMACLTQCTNPTITAVEPDTKISLSSKVVTAFSWTLSWLI